jgi:phosphotransferase system IIB component
MSKYNKKKSEAIARKLTPIFKLIGKLTEEEIEYLEGAKDNIRKEGTKLQAVGGILVDIDKAEAMERLGRQATNRVAGIILIWNALKETPKIREQFQIKKDHQKKIDSAFGL